MTKIERLQAVSKTFHDILLKYANVDSDAAMVMKSLQLLFEKIQQGQVSPPKEFAQRWYFGSTDSPLAEYGDLINAAAEFSHVIEDWPDPIVSDSSS